MEETTQTINDFNTVFDWYLASHTATETFWTIWNFIFSLFIMMLAYWRAIDIIKQKSLFHTKLEYWGVKLSLAMIAVGALFHAIQIKTPSFKEGATYTGIFLYLLLRRIKQIRDKKQNKS